MNLHLSAYQHFGLIVHETHAFTNEQISFVYVEGRDTINKLLKFIEPSAASKENEYDVRDCYYLKDGVVVVHEKLALRDLIYICESRQAYDIILYRMPAFTIGGRFIIMSTSRDNTEIRSFLSRTQFREVRSLSTPERRILACYDGRYVCVVLNIDHFDHGTTKTFLPVSDGGRQYEFRNYGFYDAIAFKSLTDLQDSHILDDTQINREKFPTTSKKILLPDSSKIEVKVMCVSAAQRFLKKSGKPVTMRATPDTFHTVVKLDDGHIAQRYDEYSFLIFQSETDLHKYEEAYRAAMENHHDKGIVITSKLSEALESADNAHQIQTTFELADSYPDWKAALRDVDNRLAGYFCEEVFEDIFFPKLAAYAGNIVLKDFPGTWILNKMENTPHSRLQFNAGGYINFVPYLLESIEDTRYNYTTPVYDTIYALLVISKH